MRLRRLRDEVEPQCRPDNSCYADQVEDSRPATKQKSTATIGGGVTEQSTEGQCDDSADEAARVDDARSGAPFSGRIPAGEHGVRRRNDNSLKDALEDAADDEGSAAAQTGCQWTDHRQQ